MPSHKKDKFLQEVLSHIKFPFDREDIKSELQCHIEDKIEYYMEEGNDRATAEQLSIEDMGDPKEIGIELNKEHNPILGWAWKISNVMVVLFLIWNIFTIGGSVIRTVFPENLIKKIPKSDIVYKLDIDKKVKIDDRVIRFTNLIYEKDGDMNIFYEYYDTKLLGRGWSLGTIGNITDDLGNVYISGSGSSSGGVKSKSRRTLRNFSKEANTLIITYDNYNRKYKVEIPLEVGDNNE